MLLDSVLLFILTNYKNHIHEEIFFHPWGNLKNVMFSALLGETFEMNINHLEF